MASEHSPYPSLLSNCGAFQHPKIFDQEKPLAQVTRIANFRKLNPLGESKTPSHIATLRFPKVDSYLVGSTRVVALPQYHFDAVGQDLHMLPQGSESYQEDWGFPVEGTLEDAKSIMQETCAQCPLRVDCRPFLLLLSNKLPLIVQGNHKVPDPPDPLLRPEPDPETKAREHAEALAKPFQLKIVEIPLAEK